MFHSYSWVHAGIEVATPCAPANAAPVLPTWNTVVAVRERVWEGPCHGETASKASDGVEPSAAAALAAAAERRWERCLVFLQLRCIVELCKRRASVISCCWPVGRRYQITRSQSAACWRRSPPQFACVLAPFLRPPLRTMRSALHAALLCLALAASLARGQPVDGAGATPLAEQAAGTEEPSGFVSVKNGRFDLNGREWFMTGGAAEGWKCWRWRRRRLACARRSLCPTASPLRPPKHPLLPPAACCIRHQHLLSRTASCRRER